MPAPRNSWEQAERILEILERNPIQPLHGPRVAAMAQPDQYQWQNGAPVDRTAGANEYGYGLPITPQPGIEPDDGLPPRVVAIASHRNDREIADEIFATMQRNDAARAAELPPMSGGSDRPVGIRISAYEGSWYNPAGHFGIGIDTGDGADGGTVGYYPAENVVVVGPGVVKTDDPAKRLDSITIPATPEEIERVTQCINERSANPGTYRLSHNDCRHFVDECMKKAGVNFLPPSVAPRDRINLHRLMAPGQPPYMSVP